MATAAQVAKASLQRILVQGSEADLEPSEYQDFIFSMNNFMLALDADGVTLGYTEISDLGDTVTIPTGALRGLIANMAVEVAPDFNGVVSPALLKQAAEGLKTMELIGVSMGVSQYPDTLPRGSGNYEDTFRDSHFYPDQEAEILAESTGSISQESGTQEAAS